MTVASRRCVATKVLLTGFLFIAWWSEKGSFASGPKTIEVDLGGVTMTLVSIPAGSFSMGSESGSEKPVHTVTLTKRFYLGKYEVTQEQWQAVMGSNPSKFKGDKLPVEQVSWNDCQEFLKQLQSKSPGLKFALPTEAQWEYACRAGNKTEYSFGDDSSRLGDHGWYSANSGSTTHEVGGKEPNAWGLYDMHGNVSEWCADWYADSYPAGAQKDPVGPSSGSGRVLRGGSWSNVDTVLRSAFRSWPDPVYRLNVIGLRVAAGTSR